MASAKHQRHSRLFHSCDKLRNGKPCLHIAAHSIQKYQETLNVRRFFDRGYKRQNMLIFGCLNILGQKLVSLYGTPDKVIPALKALVGDTEAAATLEKLTAAMIADGYGDMVRIDFSVVDEGSYYNGIVFRGFAEGVPDSVLSGGQYHRLMRQMGRRGGAVGFAVYLDRLERMPEANLPYDVDTLLLYDEGCDLTALYAAADALRQEGGVMLQKEIPQNLTYRRLCRFENGEVTTL